MLSVVSPIACRTEPPRTIRFLSVRDPLSVAVPAVMTTVLLSHDEPGETSADDVTSGTTTTISPVTLAVTPLRQWTGWAALARFRRMFGLFAAFYASLHFCAYAVFDMGLVWGDIVRDVAKRPFILVGTLALLLMLPLAATSFNRAIRALGATRWQRLHRLVYAIALLAILHFFWMRAGKNDFAEVAVYAAILAVLLGWRLREAIRKRRAPAAVSLSAAGRPHPRARG